MKVIGTYTRLFVNDLNSVLPFYESLFSEKAAFRIQYPEMNLELAPVGPFLLIAGTNEALEPFRSTSATILVDSLDEFRSYLEAHDAELLRGPRQVPTGINMTVKHQDGTIVEYVEHSAAVNQFRR